jgi:hypothetical protein
MAGKTPTATRKQEEALQAAIFAALRIRDGKTVAGEGSPAGKKMGVPFSSRERTLVRPSMSASYQSSLIFKRSIVLVSGQ